MSKLTTCEDCGGQVSINASACPHCGARRRNRCRSKIGGFISLPLIWVFAAIGGYGKHCDSEILSVIGVMGAIAAIVSVAICFTAPSK